MNSRERRRGGDGGQLEWLILVLAVGLVVGLAAKISGPKAVSGLPPKALARPVDAAPSLPAATLMTPAPPAPTMAPPEPEANSTPAVLRETMPTAACPLSSHGFGALPARGQVSSSWSTNPGDFPNAYREQESTAAPIVVYVYTDWCPYCRAFERDLLTSSDVDRYLRDNALKFRINPESSPEAQALMHRLGASAFPTFLVCAPGGMPVPLSIYGRGKRLKEPQEFIDSIEREVTGGAASLLRMGMMARQSGEVRKSIALLTLALRIKPGEAKAHVERALSFAQDGSTEDALDDLARVARDEPGAIVPYQAVSDILGQLGRWDEVIACWTELLARSPSGKAYLGRSRALRGRGLSGLSQADADRACTLGESAGCGHDAFTPTRAPS